jgi:hypothetical protein
LAGPSVGRKELLVPENGESPYLMVPRVGCAKLKAVWDDQLPRRSWRTQPKVSTREGKAGRLTYLR